MKKILPFLLSFLLALFIYFFPDVNEDYYLKFIMSGGPGIILPLLLLLYLPQAVWWKRIVYVALSIGVYMIALNIGMAAFEGKGMPMLYFLAGIVGATGFILVTKLLMHNKVPYYIVWVGVGVGVVSCLPTYITNEITYAFPFWLLLMGAVLAFSEYYIPQNEKS
jgi:hypothetical protein